VEGLKKFVNAPNQGNRNPIMEPRISRVWSDMPLQFHIISQQFMTNTFEKSSLGE
jgi:hypothetical protein